MASEIPPNFDQPWCMSDVVLHTTHSDGKDIHACKTALAMFSPYFRVLFFGDFKEKNASSVNVDCPHNVMLEILRNIHQIGYKYADKQKPYPMEMLDKMYRMADCFDFPFIRKLCVEQLEGFPCTENASVAAKLGLYESMMKIFMKMDHYHLRSFIGNAHTAWFCLTKKQFLALFAKLTEKPLPKSSEKTIGKKKEPLNLEEVTVDLENPRVDLTKPWPSADLVILCCNAGGRALHANKAMLDIMCPKFQKYITQSKHEGSGKFSANVDEDYTTMKEILVIIQICKTDFSKPDRVLHPALLHSMYCAADVDRLDIPMIRSFCVAKLYEHKSVHAVDVFCSLPCYSHSALGKKLYDVPILDLRDWIYNKGSRLSYHNGRQIVTISPNPEIGKECVFWMLSKFEGRFVPKKK